MPLLYIDSCIFIGAFEVAGSTSVALLEFFKDLQRRPGFAATSELTLAELVAPIKRLPSENGDERTSIYLDFFDRGGFVDLLPVSRPILMDTAAIRSAHLQRLPDAIHIATAVAAGCVFFMTFDRDARRLPDSLRWMTADPDDLAIILEALNA